MRFVMEIKQLLLTEVTTSASLREAMANSKDSKDSEDSEDSNSSTVKNQDGEVRGSSSNTPQLQLNSTKSCAIANATQTLEE